MMDKIFNNVSIGFGIAAGAVTWMFGEWNMALCALLAIMTIDYITGIIKAVYTKTVSSGIGFKGILKKFSILMIVVLANIIQKLLGGGLAIREIVIMFYVANEGISILENVASISTKMPQALKDILLQLRERNTK